MDSDRLLTLFDDLDARLAHLESTIKPLTTHELPALSSKLPLLDAAKLNVLSFTAIESLIFSALKVEGSIDAKAHPVHEELLRGKRYNGKIKAVEEGSCVETPGKDAQSAAGPRLRLDKGAAQRFVKGVIGDVALSKEKSNSSASSEQMWQGAGKKRKREKNKSDKNKDKRGAGNAGAQTQHDQRSEHRDDRDAQDTQENTSSNSTSVSMSRPRTRDRVKHSPPAEHSSPIQAQRQPPDPHSEHTQGIASSRNYEWHPHRNKGPPKKKRSSNTPKSNHAIFQDLLTRGGKDKDGGGGGDG